MAQTYRENLSQIALTRLLVEIKVQRSRYEAALIRERAGWKERNVTNSPWRGRSPKDCAGEHELNGNTCTHRPRLLFDDTTQTRFSPRKGIL